jgi:hypothetical protein
MQIKGGASDPGVKRIMEDRTGHIWFPSEEFGASRYDGERFTNFTVADGLPSDEAIA